MSKYHVPVALLSFFAKPLVRYVGLALLVAMVIGFAVHRFNGFKESLREEGRQQMVQKYRGIVAKNNEDNRRIERDIQSSLDGYGQRLDAALDRMNEKQRAQAQTVLKAIEQNPKVFNNPVCTTPKEVIDARNEIRKAGPKQ